MAQSLPATEEKGEQRLPAFFQNHSLRPVDYQTCLNLVQAWRPGAQVRPIESQGGCSHTIIVGPWPSDETGTTTTATIGRGRDRPEQSVVQFRLRKHALDASMVRTARAIYADCVPDLLRHVYLDLGHCDRRCAVQACEMSLIRGVSFSSLQPRRDHLWKDEGPKLRRVMVGMAHIFAAAWHDAVRATRSSAACTGKVGSSIIARLEALETKLPSPHLRREARFVRTKVWAGALDVLPVALNHGDLLPSNVIVDAWTWTVNGLVDWAEAEFLPFGMTMGGLEGLLGYMRCANERGAPAATFRYYQTADEMRRLFWETLEEAVPMLRDDRNVREAVLLSRKVGLLLWHGFAWDDGNINRVVNHVDDFTELAYLKAFLSKDNDDEMSSRL